MEPKIDPFLSAGQLIKEETCMMRLRVSSRCALNDPNQWTNKRCLMITMICVEQKQCVTIRKAMGTQVKKRMGHGK